MSWIDKITDFCKNTIGTTNEHGFTEMHEHGTEKFRAESNQLWSLNPDIDQKHEVLTPREHGTRLLKLTKERALKRIWESEQQARYSAR